MVKELLVLIDWFPFLLFEFGVPLSSVVILMIIPGQESERGADTSEFDLAMK